MLPLFSRARKMLHASHSCNDRQCAAVSQGRGQRATLKRSAHVQACADVSFLSSLAEAIEAYDAFIVANSLTLSNW